jgi:hypothetical protein
MKRRVLAVAIVAGGFALGWAAGGVGHIARGCNDACARLIALGCHNGAAGAERQRCVSTCWKTWFAGDPLPLVCVANSMSCEEAAQCGVNE